MSFVEFALTSLGKLKSRLFTTIIAGAFCSIGHKTAIIPPFRFGNLKLVSIGNGVTIHRGCYIQVLDQGKSDTGPVISIANHVSIGMGATISGTHRIVIEDYALLARNVYISDHAHQYEDVMQPICLQGIRNVAEVHIGRGAWLGQNVVILPGVSVGRNSVIGANSVVSKSIPDYCVAVGSPARIVKQYSFERIKWEKIGQ